MRRREFIAMLGTGAAAWPLAARGQQAERTRHIGFLGAASAGKYAKLVDAFRNAVSDFGYSEGKNLTIEFRWAEGNNARLPELAADLVKRHIDCLVTHGTPGTAAAKKATATVPIRHGGQRRCGRHRTAKALRLTVPSSLIAIADEVIE